MSRGANYFFGFLVTFIALLLLFIGCGLGSRRRLNRRRGLFGDFGNWDSRSEVGEPVPEPELIEPYLQKGGEIWSRIQPLSTNLVPSKPPSGFLRPVPPPMVRSPSRNPAAIHGLSLPTWRPGLPIVTDREKKMDTKDKIDTWAGQSEMQVAVMIAMPSRSRPPDADNERNPVEYQIGVAYVPWDKVCTLYLLLEDSFIP
ncbi:hypothetical protein K435DRAFT_790750 [Dendrothele bispora CBS 962.96]|uniref:Uncharacterized protein n=1 Tax=Dendrothele bispora (strain CBS 962.96) TaxID=1314807 RepID=A0A4V4HI05_DENBC|nr:hypothetical protein K435DRAFT_790750 [Dendrothele bispora CBS 962.96]